MHHGILFDRRLEQCINFQVLYLIQLSCPELLYFTTLLCNTPGETRIGAYGCVPYLVGIVCPPFEISVTQKHGEKSDATRSVT